MSHNNLMALYCYIDARRQDIEKELSAPHTNWQQKEFARGRISALSEFEDFLHDHLDCKLPRRIYRQLKSQGYRCDVRYAVGK